jgi:pseudouridine-5'-phosphate glycosidase
MARTDEGGSSPLEVSDAVTEAIRYGQGVVALESALITHGLPLPWNLEAALGAEAAVRSAESMPATVAVRAGRLAVGLSEEEISELAHAQGPLKVSRQHLAAALGGSGWGGTTVSATMLAGALAGIGVFATGGIGGVHRGAGSTFDISADLEELARTSMAVVCSGPKSLLDAAATLEYLETRGVPVVGLGTEELPGFYSRESGLPLTASVDTPEQAAELVRRHRELGLPGAVLFVVPVPDEAALSRDEAEGAVVQALDGAAAAAIRGPAATPWVLARVAEITEGRSIRANVALIEHNAGLAGQLARALAGTG